MGHRPCLVAGQTFGLMAVAWPFFSAADTSDGLDRE